MKNGSQEAAEKNPYFCEQVNSLLYFLQGVAINGRRLVPLRRLLRASGTRLATTEPEGETCDPPINKRTTLRCEIHKEGRAKPYGTSRCFGRDPQLMRNLLYNRIPVW